MDRKLALLLVFCGGLQAQVAQQIVSIMAVPPAAGISVIAATNGYSGGSLTNITAAQTVTVNAGDQLVLFAAWATSSSTNCATNTVSFTGGVAGDTYTAVGAQIPNAFTAGQCNGAFTVENSGGSGSALTYKMTVSGTGTTTPGGFILIQLRGTSNAAPDITAHYDATSGTCASSSAVCCVPHSSVTTSCNANTGATGHAGEIALAFSNATSGLTFTPKTCFGSTGTVPTNGTNNWSAVEYTTGISSGTASACGFSVSVNNAIMFQLMTIY